MKRPILLILYVALLTVLTVAYVRSAWLMPLRNFPFDFSINYTGARLIAESGPTVLLYDRTTLAVEAGPYTEYPLYTKLFLTYIQTPLTAVLLLPISGLSLDDARLTFLAVSNVMLIAAAAIMIYALRPTKLLIFAAFLIFATYEAMFDSLRLGQVDGVIVLLLALSFLALRRGHSVMVGAPLAGAAILKLSPAIVIGFFIWRRNWRVVAGAVIAGVFLLGFSIYVAGWDNHRTFVEDISPRLSKGSTLYDNVSISGALARGYFGEASWLYEDEVPGWPLGLRAAALLLSAAVVIGGYILGSKDVEAGFMLSCATAVLVSPIAWSFYPVWLIPSFLFLVHRFEQRRAWSRLALLAALYPLIAIVPAHFSAIDPEIYRYPIKTIVLALYWVLLAWEAQTRPPLPRTAVPRDPAPAVAGART
ncbi:MAG: glycosyltransferase family 87 protein [Dehalococcoidia bacterium]